MWRNGVAQRGVFVVARVKRKRFHLIRRNIWTPHGKSTRTAGFHCQVHQPRDILQAPRPSINAKMKRGSWAARGFFLSKLLIFTGKEWIFKEASFRPRIPFSFMMPRQRYCTYILQWFCSRSLRVFFNFFIIFFLESLIFCEIPQSLISTSVFNTKKSKKMNK